MHGGIGGEDGAGEVVGGAGPVADGSAGLFDQEATGRDVPGGEGEFEEAVEDPGGGPGEVERGGARAAEVLEAIQGGVEHAEVAREQLLAAEREAGGHHGSIGRALAHREAGGARAIDGPGARRRVRPCT